MSAFIDTNILVRHLTGDPPDMAARASRFLAEERDLLLADLVVAETIYVLESFYEAPRGDRRVDRALIAFESVVCVDPSLLLRAVEIYEVDRLDFAEAYLVACAESAGSVGSHRSIAASVGSPPSSESNRCECSAAGDECDDDLGGVAIEVLAASVVDRGGARVGVASGDLHVTQRDPGVECGHDERRAQHVRVDVAETGSLANCFDPAVCGASVEALAVASSQDRAFAPFADGEVDGASRSEGRVGWWRACCPSRGS